MFEFSSQLGLRLRSVDVVFAREAERAVVKVSLVWLSFGKWLVVFGLRCLSYPRYRTVLMLKRLLFLPCVSRSVSNLVFLGVVDSGDMLLLLSYVPVSVLCVAI